MHSAIRVAVASAIVATATFIISADTTPASEASEVQLRIGDLLFAEGRFSDSLDAYRNALKTAPADATRRPRMGVIASALRVAEFGLARLEAEKLHQSDPKGPDATALYADALWSSGLFQEAESAYRDALAAAPELARGRHGVARSLAARSHLEEALGEAQAALRLSPRDLEIHHTVGTIFERMHKYEEAASAYANYVNLLPNKDKSDKAEWARKLPETEAVEFGDVSLYVLHDLANLDLKPAAAGFRVVIYGHSHVPKQEMREGVLYFNPGSAGPRRFKLPISLGRLIIEGGSVRGEIVSIQE